MVRTKTQSDLLPTRLVAVNRLLNSYIYARKRKGIHFLERVDQKRRRAGGSALFLVTGRRDVGFRVRSQTSRAHFEEVILNKTVSTEEKLSKAKEMC